MGIENRTKAGVYTFYLLYCFALLGVTLYLTNPNSLLSESLRIGLLFLTLLPLFYQKNLAIFTLVPMLCVSLASFCPVLPTSSVYYIIVVPIIALFLIKSRLDAVMRYTLLALFYFFLVSAIYGDDFAYIYWIIIAVLIVACIKDETDCELFSTAIMLTSIGICLLYILFAQYFLVKISSDLEGGLERAQWLNPNELAGMINCGGIIAAGLLTGFFKHNHKSRFFLFLEILTIILVTIVNVINASRGGSLTFIMMIVVFMMFSKAKVIYKICIAVGLAILMIFISKEGFFETLLFRMSEESLYSASGRTDIWAVKLHEFFGGNLSPLTLIIGIGKKGAATIGSNISTHNDFVTALIGFGFIGLFLYLSVFVVMINKTRKENRIKLLLLLFYLALESSRLEFFFRGYLIILLLLFFSYRYFMIVNSKDSQ